MTTTTPDSGSGLPDIGYTAYWLMKVLPELGGGGAADLVASIRTGQDEGWNLDESVEAWMKE